jgi:hypothetical protein
MVPGQETGFQKVEIFISSPSDVGKERQIIKDAIRRLDKLPSINSKYALRPLAYEDIVPPESGDYAQGIVDQYMLSTDCYLVICVFWTRMGTAFSLKDGRRFNSGTEYEYLSAYESQLARDRPRILLYRNLLPNPNADPEQKALVDQFFQQFEGSPPKLKGLYKTFTDYDEFAEMVFQHIVTVLEEHPPRQSPPTPSPIDDFLKRQEIQEEIKELEVRLPRLEQRLKHARAQVRITRDVKNASQHQAAGIQRILTVVAIFAAAIIGATIEPILGAIILIGLLVYFLPKLLSSGQQSEDSSQDQEVQAIEREIASIQNQIAEKQGAIRDLRGKQS